MKRRTSSNFFVLLSIAAILVPIWATSSHAAPINLVSPGTLSFEGTINFDGIDMGGLVSKAIDDILVLSGASFAERFNGQTLSTTQGVVGPLDVLTGTPNNPLTLVAGAVHQNLDVDQATAYGGPGGFLSGIGTAGTTNAGVGEGAISILFDSNVSAVGIDILAGDNGSVWYKFFRRDGSLIANLSTGAGSGGPVSFEFQREGDLLDIAGISITNLDPNGMGIDNLKFKTSGATAVPVPEPTTLLLLASGLVGLVGLRRKFRRN
jgi:hypothetical protein